MTTLTTGTNNDLVLSSSGSVSLSTGLSAIMQTCEHAVKTSLGELVLQGDEGIPNFQMIWSGAPNIAQAENALREALMKVEGVESVPELSAFVSENILYYNAVINTINGEANLGL